MRLVEKLTEEQEQIIDELVERVLENGGLELEIEIELLDSMFRFKMPDQMETERAMDEAGRDTHGQRDAYTREVLFSRLILSESLISVDEYPFDRQMARSLFSRLQPGAVQALFSKFALIRETHNSLIAQSMARAKKSQPNPSIGPDGNSPA